ncbi:MAG: hypothetical protein QOG62_822 [Thermoleophilaceae bacterium]|jgi:hypothetical protein|nr:hypothetical protein [Thermoleophilaceae bacterium]
MENSATHTRLSPELAARLEQLALELIPQTDVIAADVNRVAIAAEPDLIDPDDPLSVEAVLHSTKANAGAILSQLAYGVPGSASEPSTGALELFERLADRDDGLQIVLRGYRLGVAELWQIWARHVSERVDDAGDLYEILAASTSHMLTAVDRISVSLGEQWAATRRRRRQGLDISPDDLVRDALAGNPGALERLGYDRERVHQAIALAPRMTEAEVTQLSGRLKLIADAQVAQLQRDAGWVIWLGLPREPELRIAEQIEAALPTGEPVGLGEPASGFAGFRVSHREALDARRVGVMRGTPGVTHHRDVALLALLTADPERARGLALAELGPLADGDESTARLRETLIAYLACGESHVGAAERLHVHQKTVAYRVRQAEEIIGRRIGDRRAELEAALQLHAAFSSEDRSGP